MSGNDPNPLKSWSVIASKITFRDQWLTLRSDEVRLPNGQTLAPYHTVEGPDWVSIIAITADDQVILTEEYRHGARRVLMQFPGGHIDPGEEAREAGARELLEETGYGRGDWHDIGAMFGAAARLSAVVRVFLVLGVEQIASPKAEHGEDIRVVPMSWRAFLNDLQEGRIDIPDTCDLASLMRLQLLASRSKNPAIARL